MAGLVPAIHVLRPRKIDVDARHKAGHDDDIVSSPSAKSRRPHFRFDYQTALEDARPRSRPALTRPSCSEDRTLDIEEGAGNAG
jgi:hypothetical protein